MDIYSLYSDSAQLCKTEHSAGVKCSKGFRLQSELNASNVYVLMFYIFRELVSHLKTLMRLRSGRQINFIQCLLWHTFQYISNDSSVKYERVLVACD